MRKTTLIFFAFFSFALGISAQTVIDNPDQPASKNAGRTVPLQEVLRIKDEGKGYFFKLPWMLDVAADGSIFVQDGCGLYKFSPGGQFEKNLIKIGQGPGEIRKLTNFLVGENEMILFSMPSNKLIKLDGKYLDNFWLPLVNIRTGDAFFQRYFPVVIQGDFLYAIEHDAAWNFSIAKYRI